MSLILKADPKAVKDEMERESQIKLDSSSILLPMQTAENR
jgi:hypothetical protein